MRIVKLSNGSQLVLNDEWDEEYCDALIAQQEEQQEELRIIREGLQNVERRTAEPRPTAIGARRGRPRR